MSENQTNDLIVQVVNDSDRSDDQVYLLLTGDTVTVSSGTITTLELPQSTTGSTSAGALGDLDSNGTLVSPDTGETRTIYQFSVSAVTSGRLLVSYDSALTYADNAAPTATSQSMRWDKMEFGYPGSGADLTSIDFFAIPMQFEYLDAAGNVMDTMTFYTSTPTLLSSLYDLHPATMADAFQKSSGGSAEFGWSPTDGLSAFLRAIGPQTLTANNGSPAPYPSFKGYLDALADTGTAFTIGGNAGVGAPAPGNNNVDYLYSGSVQSDGDGGYKVALTGTTTVSGTATGPWGLYTDTSNVTTAKQLPASLPVTLLLPKGSFDNDLYGAPATAFTVGQSSDPGDKATYIDPTLVPYTDNSAYATIAGDFISGMNFGYLGGRYGEQSSAWYNNPPTPYPFGAARLTDDGCYNPFAALLYNLSDTYGFPFSDRGGRPSPYVPLPSGATTMRITILNDHRLDPPRASVSAVGDTSLTVSWEAVTAPTGFTLGGYTLSVEPSDPATVITLTAEQTSHTLTGLTPGTRYTFRVAATGTANGNAVSSRAIPLSATTGGTATQPAGDLTFLVSLNWGSAAPMPAGSTFTINGTSYTPGDPPSPPVTVQGVDGVNIFPLIMKNAAGEVVYQSNYVIELKATTGGYERPSGGAFVLEGNGQPLTEGSTPPYSASAGSQLVVGTPFSPVADKRADPVCFPRAAYAVANRWGGDTAPWHNGGIWVLGARSGQSVIALNASSSDGGKTLSGTMTYSGEGPIGFRATLEPGRSESNILPTGPYRVENQWGGDSAPWHEGGSWVIGGRSTQNVVAIDIASSDDGATLNGTLTYDGEGPIDFRATRV